MRQRTDKLVISFPSTTTALAMEAACGSGRGRLIPVPVQLSAGCGLAWCAEPALAEELEDIMRENNIDYKEKKTIPLL